MGRKAPAAPFIPAVERGGVLRGAGADLETLETLEASQLRCPLRCRLRL